MPFIPTARLCLLALLPLGLGVAMVAQPALLVPMLAADVLLALVAALDAFLGRRRTGHGRAGAAPGAVGRAAQPGAPAAALAGGAPAAGDRDRRSVGRAERARAARWRLTCRRWGGPSLVYHVRPSRRGMAALADHHLRYPTPLGLWRRQLRLPAHHPVKVYPDVAAVRGYELLARQSRENLLVRAIRLRGGRERVRAPARVPARRRVPEHRLAGHRPQEPPDRARVPAGAEPDRAVPAGQRPADDRRVGRPVAAGPRAERHLDDGPRGGAGRATRWACWPSTPRCGRSCRPPAAGGRSTGWCRPPTTCTPSWWRATSRWRPTTWPGGCASGRWW